MKSRFSVIFLLALCIGLGVKAQDVAVKTNLLYDATLTVNAGVEVGLAPRWTFDLSGNWNSWSTSHKGKWKHWMLQPEARYWFCERFNGHFVGLHALGGQMNVGHIDFDPAWFGTGLPKLSSYRYQGHYLGGGLAYGYSWILGRHFNLEAEVGVGYVHLWYDTYECAGCGKQVEKDKDTHYIGPTKAAINLIYVF